MKETACSWLYLITKKKTRSVPSRWLPYELRQRFKHANIGWFLHTPFPSSEIYRILPVRKALLEALLAADLLGRWARVFSIGQRQTRSPVTYNGTYTSSASPTPGFHTYDYARHFLSACGRVLEVDTTPRGLEYASHFMSLGMRICARPNAGLVCSG